MIAGLYYCRLPSNFDLQGQTIASFQFGRFGDTMMGPDWQQWLWSRGKGNPFCPWAPLACTKFAAERMNPLLICMDLLCNQRALHPTHECSLQPPHRGSDWWRGAKREQCEGCLSLRRTQLNQH